MECYGIPVYLVLQLCQDTEQLALRLYLNCGGRESVEQLVGAVAVILRQSGDRD